MPFTIAFIKSTNDKLFAKKDQLATTALDNKAAEAGVAQNETVNALLDKWATLNLARAVLVAIGSLCAVLRRFRRERL